MTSEPFRFRSDVYKLVEFDADVYQPSVIDDQKTVIVTTGYKTSL